MIPILKNAVLMSFTSYGRLPSRACDRTVSTAADSPN
jgi:hypothetical protein